MDSLDSAQALLAQGLDNLGLATTETQRQQLLAHLQLILRWNRVYNLTAVRDPLEMVTHHLLDSLAVVPALRRHIQGQGRSGAERPHLLDVGSGAGLPGVALAILEPDWRVTCVDAVAKKASFIRQVGAELGLPHLQAEHRRVEAWAPLQPFDLITARAFAALPDLVRWTQHLLAPGGVWAALKGRQPDDEIAALPTGQEMFHVEPLTVPGLDAQRCLVWIRPSTAP